jgi:mono/diheme cytochrome c family protein
MDENPYERDGKAAAEGKGIYLEKCADCHGKDLKGGDGPSLVGHLKYGEEDGKKFESISKGRGGGMPAFETELGRDRIWKVLAYVDSVREYGKKP